MTWNTYSARALGNKYKDDPRGCQDFAIAHKDDQRILTVVCDGAGSAKYSHFASSGISQAIALFLEQEQDLFDLEIDLFKKKILSVIARETQVLVSRHQAKQNDLLTTLLFVCYSPNLRQAWVGHVGDGLIVGVKDTHIEILSHSEVGEMHNLTFFTLNAFQDQTKLRISKLTEIDLKGFACFSDGLEDVIYLKRRKLREAFLNAQRDPLHPNIYDLFLNIGQHDSEYLEKAIRSHWIESELTDDDCSIAMALNQSLISELNKEEIIHLYELALAPDPVLEKPDIGHKPEVLISNTSAQTRIVIVEFPVQELLTLLGAIALVTLIGLSVVTIIIYQLTTL